MEETLDLNIHMNLMPCLFNLTTYKTLAEAEKHAKREKRSGIRWLGLRPRGKTLFFGDDIDYFLTFSNL